MTQQQITGQDTNKTVKKVLFVPRTYNKFFFITNSFSAVKCFSSCDLFPHYLPLPPTVTIYWGIISVAPEKDSKGISIFLSV